MIQTSTPGRNEAGTPQLLFDNLCGEYRFTIDVCASKSNAKLLTYWSISNNGLLLPWDGYRAWCNPPYMDIQPWLEKSVEASFSVYLLPSRTDRLWWKDWKPRAECHYLVGQKPHQRPQFEAPPGVTYSSNPMSLVLFLFGAGATAGHEAYRSGIDGRRL